MPAILRYMSEMHIFRCFMIMSAEHRLKWMFFTSFPWHSPRLLDFSTRIKLQLYRLWRACLKHVSFSPISASMRDGRLADRATALLGCFALMAGNPWAIRSNYALLRTHSGLIHHWFGCWGFLPTFWNTNQYKRWFVITFVVCKLPIIDDIQFGQLLPPVLISCSRRGIFPCLGAASGARHGNSVPKRKERGTPFAPGFIDSQC